MQSVWQRNCEVWADRWTFYCGYLLITMVIATFREPGWGLVLGHLLERIICMVVLHLVFMAIWPWWKRVFGHKA